MFLFGVRVEKNVAKRPRSDGTFLEVDAAGGPARAPRQLQRLIPVMLQAILSYKGPVGPEVEDTR